MDKYKHSDDFEYKGIWWLPENPERRVPGTVTVNDDGINLELFGLLRKPTELEGRNTQPDFILGRVHLAGGLITLYQAFETGSTIPFGSIKAGSYTEPPRLHHSSYGALYMFFGAHFASESEMRFPSL